MVACMPYNIHALVHFQVLLLVADYSTRHEIAGMPGGLPGNLNERTTCLAFLAAGHVILDYKNGGGN